MKLTVQYSSSRADVWHFYWRAWRGGLWKINLMMGVLAGLLIYQVLAAKNLPTKVDAGWTLFAAAVPQIFNIIFPQLMFKAKTRTLSIDEIGWHTEIGRKVGSLAWSKVRSVEMVDGAILICSKNGNALVVPSRAFQTETEQQNFLAFATAAHQADNA